MKKTQLLNDIGQRIKRIRKEKSISQQDLANMCEFEKARMSRLESGNANPTVVTLYKISKALDVHISELNEGLSLESYLEPILSDL